MLTSLKAVQQWAWLPGSASPKWKGIPSHVPAPTCSCCGHFIQRMSKLKQQYEEENLQTWELRAVEAAHREGQLEQHDPGIFALFSTGRACILCYLQLTPPPLCSSSNSDQWPYSCLPSRCCWMSCKAEAGLMHHTFLFKCPACSWNAAREMEGLSVGAHHTDPNKTARGLLPVVLVLGRNGC